MKTKLSLPREYEYTGKTILAYTGAIRRFNAWNGNRPITPERMAEHFNWLKEKNYRPASVCLAKTALRKCYSTDWSKIHTGRPAQKPPESALLDKKTVKKMIVNADKKTGVLIEFLYLTGARIEESLKIKIGDCSHTGKEIIIKTIGKGGHDRTLIISKGLFNKIIEIYQSEEYLFQNGTGRYYTRSWAWRKIKKAGEDTGKENVYPHLFRHSIATRLLNEGENLAAVSGFLGHSSAVVTSRYYTGTVRKTTLRKIEYYLT